MKELKTNKKEAIRVYKDGRELYAINCKNLINFISGCDKKNRILIDKSKKTYKLHIENGFFGYRENIIIDNIECRFFGYY